RICLLFCIPIILCALLTTCTLGLSQEEASPTDRVGETELEEVSPITTWTGEVEPISPSELHSSMIDQIVTVQGEVAFIDKGLDGLFLGIFGGGEVIGVFIDNQIYQNLPEDQKAQFQEGRNVVVSGVLVFEYGELTILYLADDELREPDIQEPNEDSSVTADEAGHLTSYRITDNPASRWQDITLIITDENGSPLSGIEVSYEQTDLDFFFCASPAPNKAWAPVVDGYWDWNWESRTPDAEEREREYAAVGFNTERSGLGLWWKDAEPEYDNNWQNVGGPFAWWLEQSWNYRENPALPGIRFFFAGLGPSFAPGLEGPENPGALDPSNWTPQWMNHENEDEYKEQYAEYLEKIIEVTEITIGSGYDLYEIGGEINNWWNLPWRDRPTWFPASKEVWVEWIELIKWQVDLLISLDPDAKICMDFDHMGWSDEYSSHLGPQPMIEEMIKQGVQFDVIGFEIHPGSFPLEYDTVEFWRGFLDEMEQYGKEIYIWEYAVRDHGEPLPAPDWAPTWVPPVTEYTEEYQNEVFMRVFKMFIEDPKVIGVSLLDYCDSPPEVEYREMYVTGESMGSGLLREDRTQKPLYNTLKDYWYSLMAEGSEITDLDGKITFNAIPGLFDITVDSENLETIHIK
ncbi:hypothetical protein ACFLWD_03680, partial [Chloroflexota bacterium]